MEWVARTLPRLPTKQNWCTTLWPKHSSYCHIVLLSSTIDKVKHHNRPKCWVNKHGSTTRQQHSTTYIATTEETTTHSTAYIATTEDLNCPWNWLAATPQFLIFFLALSWNEKSNRYFINLVELQCFTNGRTEKTCASLHTGTTLCYAVTLTWLLWPHFFLRQLTALGCRRA